MQWVVNNTTWDLHLVGKYSMELLAGHVIVFRTPWLWEFEVYGRGRRVAKYSRGKLTCVAGFRLSSKKDGGITLNNSRRLVLGRAIECIKP